MTDTTDGARKLAEKVVTANQRIYVAIAILSSGITASLCCGLAGLAWALWR